MTLRTILLLLLPAGILFAQDPSMPARDASLNFAVPDAPAFTILNYTPSVILRPVTVREVALAVADFVRGGSVLPRAFAAEFSPGLLVGGGKLTIRDYQEKPFWHRTRVSVASRSFDDNTGRVQASLGLRFTLTDNTDPRMDGEFISNMGLLARRINQAIAKKVQETPPTGTGPILESDVDIQALEAEVEKLREQRKQRWNARIVELAAAARIRSADSLAENAMIDKYQVWSAGSFTIDDWGQIIGNVVGSLERSQSGFMDSTSLSFAARFYYGSNSFKAFAESQLTAAKKSAPSYLANIGGELNAISSFWLEFAAGIEKRGNQPAVIRTSFNIRWGIPEMLVR